MDTYWNPVVVLGFTVLMLGLLGLFMQSGRQGSTVVYIPIEMERQNYGIGCLPLLVILVVIVILLIGALPQ